MAGHLSNYVSSDLHNRWDTQCQGHDGAEHLL